ncbi:MAG: hypothetical protein H8E37_03355 [Planctomycetes bacterium]|nr:hypothetical protein [Planctomycetota bacterium]
MPPFIAFAINKEKWGKFDHTNDSAADQLYAALEAHENGYSSSDFSRILAEGYRARLGDEFLVNASDNQLLAIATTDAVIIVASFYGGSALITSKAGWAINAVGAGTLGVSEYVAQGVAYEIISGGTARDMTLREGATAGVAGALFVSAGHLPIIRDGAEHLTKIPGVRQSSQLFERGVERAARSRAGQAFRRFADSDLNQFRWRSLNEQREIISFLDRGRLGGEIIDGPVLEKLQERLSRNGVIIRQDDEAVAILTSREAAGAFRPVGDGAEILLLHDATRYEIMHELRHYMHWLRDPKAYKQLKGRLGEFEREQFVFQSLTRSPHWRSRMKHPHSKAFTKREREDAKAYFNEVKFLAKFLFGE